MLTWKPNFCVRLLLTRFCINDLDYKYFQNSELWNWKLEKCLEDNLELLLCSVNKRQEKYTVLGPSGLPMGFTENFAIVNTEYRSEIDLLLLFLAYVAKI